MPSDVNMREKAVQAFKGEENFRQKNRRASAPGGGGERGGW